MSKKAILLGSALVAIPGCGHVEGERPLSSEHDELLGNLLEREPEATAMAAEMAERMEVGIVDAKGIPASGRDLARSVEATGAWLQKAFASGRVMEADPEQFASDDLVAQYDRESAETRSDDRIIMSSDVRDWNLPTALHEAAHKLFFHDAFIKQRLIDAGAKLNGEYAVAVAEHRDYPYLVTALYAVPSALIAEMDAAIEGARERAEEVAAKDGAFAAQRWLAEEVAMPSESEMLARVDALYDEVASCLSSFGLSGEDLREAYLESGMHEALEQRREGAVAEFGREFRKELSPWERGRIL